MPLPDVTAEDEINVLRSMARKIKEENDARNAAVQESWKQANNASANSIKMQQIIGIKDETKALEDSFGSLTASTNGVLEGMLKLKAILDAMPTPGTVPGHASGGQIFSSKGTDTVPAMLTPGEYVVDQKTTERHLPLLRKLKYLAVGGLADDAQEQLNYMYAQYGLKRHAPMPIHTGLVSRASSDAQLEHMYSTYGLHSNYSTLLPHQQLARLRESYGIGRNQTNFDANALAYHVRPTQTANGMTSVTFGNINVTVQSSGDTRTDVRYLISELQREIRRTGVSFSGAKHD